MKQFEYGKNDVTLNQMVFWIKNYPSLGIVVEDDSGDEAEDSDEDDGLYGSGNDLSVDDSCIESDDE